MQNVRRSKRKPRFDGETLFENKVREYAPLIGCWYEKIPDTIKTKDSLIKKSDGSFTMVAFKRPCDGIFSRPKGNLMVEFKFNDGQLKAHQKEYIDIVGRINDQSYVLRMRLKKTSKGMPDFVYYIEKGWGKDKKVLLETRDLIEFLKYLKNV